MVESEKLARRFGVILVIIGFATLFVDAFDYLCGFFGLSSEINLPSSEIGVVFLVVGWVGLLLRYLPEIAKCTVVPNAAPNFSPLSTALLRLARRGAGLMLRFRSRGSELALV